ncbi:hypothetical protein AT959_16180 [Dechloromonas denitrificans]|uniref:Formylmethanofuran dehydrogenase subunit E domain-containing protein n=1 Tax=Dechloromonas denitrificans TaxID=281362 RepID=A0A133XF10_9RHOO|nr:hypothetical protein [Dechloromonas denitrificans]KXB29486.1 hypothetical protein AT959_16180 [Dechloromonas denitrificans]
MAFPDYFSRIPTITLHDPLAEVLGAAEGGLIEYSFADAVRLTGHACPTVAGAWLTGVGALRVLYGNELPRRGEIEVGLHEAEDSGVSGVIASVLGLLTGAAGPGGFKGLGGQFRRNRRLHFAEPGLEYIRLRRIDTGLSVDCRLDLSAVPGDPRSGPLLGAILAGVASPAERQLFAELWQDRVRRILLDDSAGDRLLKFTLSD